MHMLYCLTQFLRDLAGLCVPKLHLVEHVGEEFPSCTVLRHNVIVMTVPEGLDKAKSVRMVNLLERPELIRYPSLVTEVARDGLHCELLENTLS